MKRYVDIGIEEKDNVVYLILDQIRLVVGVL